MAQSQDLPGSRWVRSPETLWRCAGGTLVLLPQGDDDRTPVVVSGSAALVWELLATPITLPELASRLSQLCDTSAQVIASDLAPLLDQLNAATAVERVS
ncbi:MAG TPA: PqqD family protein [Acidimicrobiales bacterium]|nr:PqqD family protein [Acidimicrobiales bacterium]